MATKQEAMASRYANTRVGTGKNDYGYTGIPNNQARGLDQLAKKVDLTYLLAV